MQVVLRSEPCVQAGALLLAETPTGHCVEGIAFGRGLVFRQASGLPEGNTKVQPNLEIAVGLSGLPDSGEMTMRILCEPRFAQSLKRMKLLPRHADSRPCFPDLPVDSAPRSVGTYARYGQNPTRPHLSFR